MAARRGPGRPAHRSGYLGHLVWGVRPGRPWRALIDRTGRCAVLIGAIGLWAIGSAGAPTRIETRLEQAAQSGELVGGLVAAAHC